MTAKEKAKELFDKMSGQTYSYQQYAGAHYSTDEIGWEAGKKCALIAVKEIMKVIPLSDNPDSYWKQVESEIELL